MAEETQTTMGAAEEQTPKKSNKELWMENIRKKNPERDFSNEDDMYAASMEGYDAEHERNKQWNSDNEKLTTILTENPDVAMFIKSLIEGKMWEGMAYLDDIKPRKEGDEGWNEYQASIADRKAKADKAEQDIADYNKNIEEAAPVLKQFAEDNNMSEEEATDFIKGIISIVAEKLFTGKIDRELLDMFYNAQNRDADLATAKQAGRVQGRNEKIDDMRKKQTATDGLPSLASTGGAKAPEAPAEESNTLKSLKSLNRSKSNRERFF